MSSLQSTSQRKINVDPKQALRTYVDQLPLKEQVAFVTAAFQLIADRFDTREAALVPIVTSNTAPRRETMRSSMTQW
jgi:hypothetical protein